MESHKISLKPLEEQVRKFVKERGWEQYHNPKSMSMYLTMEAAELMELFVFCDNEQSKLVLEEKREKVEHELADIFYWLLDFAALHNIDLVEALQKKMELNRQKYPIEKCFGKSAKYTEL